MIDENFYCSECRTKLVMTELDEKAKEDFKNSQIKMPGTGPVYQAKAYCPNGCLGDTSYLTVPLFMFSTGVRKHNFQK